MADDHWLCGAFHRHRNGDLYRCERPYGHKGDHRVPRFETDEQGDEHP